MLLSSEFVCIGQLNLTAFVASTNYYNCLDIQQRAASGFFQSRKFFCGLCIYAMDVATRLVNVRQPDLWSRTDVACQVDS